MSIVLQFALKGCIVACALNVPGVMYNSTVTEWGNEYKELETNFELNRGRCVVNSAFRKRQYPFLIKRAQD